MRVAIIGTAGAAPDADSMSKELYSAIYFDAYQRLLKWSSNPVTDIDLVSGGAAWADHIAVSLWLDSKVRSLTLYLPAPFVEGKFLETAADQDPGRRANRLHHKFSRKMGASTLAGIQRAIAIGASVWAITPEILMTQPELPSNPFLARNLFIGRCDAILAYTWSDRDNFPGENGTIHTWTQSDAPEEM
jgi:hypothetical protein